MKIIALSNRSLKQLTCTFGKYFIVGAIAGLFSILVREVLSLLFYVDTPFYYALTVVLAYSAAIFMSFYGHKIITFNHKKVTRSTYNALMKFSLIAIVGLITTTLLSLLYRYTLHFEYYFGSNGDTLSFIAAAVTASFVTFTFNSKYTFTDNSN